MKDELAQSLLQAFNAEMRERLTRARALLLESDAGTGSLSLDALHQEFDSLHGAARAVNCAELEVCYRQLAEYARWLRRRFGDGAPGQDRTLLLQGVERGLRCATTGRCHECQGEATGFLHLIANRMHESGPPGGPNGAGE